MKNLLMGLMIGFVPLASAGTTELHWRVCEGSHALLQKLPESDKKKPRWTYYFDDSQTTHYQDGVVLRFRWDQKKGGTSTVKLLGYSQVPGEWENLNGFKCEQDYRGTTVSSACSLKRNVPELQARLFLNGQAHPKQLFDALQHRFVSAVRKGIRWQDILIAGPIFTRRWEWDHFEGEELTLPSGKNYLELSTRTEGYPKQKYPRWTRGFEKHGVRLCPTTASKTHWALTTH